MEIDYTILKGTLDVIEDNLKQAIQQFDYNTEDVTNLFNTEIVPKILKEKFFDLYAHLPGDLHNVICKRSKSYFLKFCINLK